MAVASPAASERQVDRPWTAAAVLASFAFFGVRLFQLVDRNAVDVLFRDQWFILSPEFAGKGIWAMARLQVGPHRQGLGGVWLHVVYGLTGWNVRTDCFLTAGVLVLSAAIALDVKRRLAGPLDPFDAAVPPLFLGLANFELFAVTPNPAHGALPLLLAVGAAWALARESFWLLALVGVLASHTGFATYLAAAVVGLALLLAIRDRSARPLGAAAAVAASLCLFFVGYHFAPAVPCFVFPHPRPSEYVYFLGFFLMRPFGTFPTGSAVAHAAGAVAAFGALALFAVTVIRALRPTEGARTFAVAALLVAFSLLFGGSAAVGRVCTGLNGAFTSRYVPYALPFWFAIYLLLRRTRWATSELPRRLSTRRRATAVAALLFAAFVGKEVDPTMNLSTARAYSEPKRRWRACYLRLHDPRACDAETGFPIDFSADVSEQFEFLRRHHLSVYRDRR